MFNLTNLTGITQTKVNLTQNRPRPLPTNQHRAPNHALMPCTTHAWPSLPVNQNPILTGTQPGVFQLHHTAALCFKHGLSYDLLRETILHREFQCILKCLGYIYFVFLKLQDFCVKPKHKFSLYTTQLILVVINHLIFSKLFYNR